MSINEFELRKYYKEQKVHEKYGQSFRAFKEMVSTDAPYRILVEVYITSCRRDPVKQRIQECAFECA